MVKHVASLRLSEFPSSWFPKMTTMPYWLSLTTVVPCEYDTPKRHGKQEEKMMIRRIDLIFIRFSLNSRGPYLVSSVRHSKAQRTEASSLGNNSSRWNILRCPVRNSRTATTSLSSKGGFYGTWGDLWEEKWDNKILTYTHTIKEQRLSIRSELCMTKCRDRQQQEPRFLDTHTPESFANRRYLWLNLPFPSQKDESNFPNFRRASRK